MTGIGDVISRFKSAKGLRYDGELAELLGMSQNNFSNQKKRGTLLRPLINLAIEQGIDVEWLVHGTAPGEIQVHSETTVNRVLAQIIGLEGVDQPMEVTTKEALIIIMMRELSPERRQQYVDSITESYLVAKRR